MNTINYSIIIPHKNIPKLLERCLASIPQRDDIQVIVVDDNSDADIVETWRATSLPKYPHVEFVFAKNKNGRKGAGYARNIGLEHAKGKWIVFADADDFFMPCVDEAMTQYADDEHDVVFFFCNSVDSDTLQPANREEYLNNRLKHIQKTGNWEIAFRLAVCWARFIKHDVIRQHALSFPEIYTSEDLPFVNKLSVVTTNQTIADYDIYCVTERKGSLMTDKRAKTQKLRFKMACWSVDYLNRYGQGHQVKKNVNYWWTKLYNASRLQAILSVPRLIKTNGWDYSRTFLRKFSKKRFKNWRRGKNSEYF